MSTPTFSLSTPVDNSEATWKKKLQNATKKNVTEIVVRVSPNQLSILLNKLPYYVSRNIHKWIDLVFGYKQRGKTAELSNNLFYHLCYEGAVDMEKIHDLEERYALEVQIGEFGQVPKQLFNSPHPARIIFEGMYSQFIFLY